MEKLNISNLAELIKYAIRDYPLDTHPQALAAAKTARCAEKQNKFSEMRNLLFTEQDRWSYQNNAADIFKEFASSSDSTQQHSPCAWKTPEPKTKSAKI
jgi:protein-disulfide isomerase